MYTISLKLASFLLLLLGVLLLLVSGGAKFFFDVKLVKLTCLSICFIAVAGMFLAL